MRIPEEQLNTAIFVCIDKEDSSGTPQRQPIGTAFRTVIKGTPTWDGYIVTAAHVLDGIGNRPFYLRFNTDISFDDIETHRDDWFIHDSADVALTRVRWGVYTMYSIYPETFVEADYRIRIGQQLLQGLARPGEIQITVEAGNQVSVAGLFVQYYGETKSLPIARFGHISRMPSEPVKFKGPGEIYSEQPVYLVELQSWGGLSGSPVFCHYQATQAMPFEVTVFLGLISGHFDITQKASTSDDIVGNVTVAINSGIALVTPAEAVRELLMRDDVIEERVANRGH